MRMKFLAGVFFLLAALSVNGQNYSEKAIGLRFGGGLGLGAEISYQQPFQRNRMELDLGWGSGRHWNGWQITGMYQWVMPIESGFYWYLGVGPALGVWNEYDDHYEDRSGGVYLAAALNIGAEYKFAEIPLQVAIDFRPELGLINRWDNFGGGLGLAVRYCF